MHAFIASTEKSLIWLSLCHYLTADLLEIINGITKWTQEFKGKGSSKLTPSTIIEVTYAYIGCMKIFRNSRSHLKFTGTRRLIRSKCHIEVLYTNGVTVRVQNSVARATGWPRIVYPWPTHHAHSAKSWLHLSRTDYNSQSTIGLLVDMRNV